MNRFGRNFCIWFFVLSALAAFSGCQTSPSGGGGGNSSTGGSSSSSSSSSSISSVSPPAQPTGVNATAGDGSVIVAWNAVTGASSYNIYRSATTGVTTSNGAKTAGVSNPYSDNTVANGHTYYYIVTAVNSGGEGPVSAQVSATPQATLPPSSPVISAAAISTTAVVLTWSAVPYATSYNIYWSTTPGVTKGTGTEIAAVTSPYTNTGLSDGTVYYYIGTASNGNGESAASPQASARPVPYIFSQVIVNAGTGNGLHEFVSVTESNNGAAISTDAVTVNGVSLPFSGTGYQNNGDPYSAGALITVDVSDAGRHYIAVGTNFTSYPSVTVPLNGTIWTNSVTNTVTWSGGAPTAGANYFVGVMDQNFGNWYYYTNTVLGEQPFDFPTGATTALVPDNSTYTNPASVYTNMPMFVLVGIGMQGLTTLSVDGVLFTNALPHSSLYVGAAAIVSIILTN